MQMVTSREGRVSRNAMIGDNRHQGEMSRPVRGV